jgi:hypothetical protein
LFLVNRLLLLLFNFDLGWALESALNSTNHLEEPHNVQNIKHNACYRIVRVKVDWHPVPVDVAGVVKVGTSQHAKADSD